MNLNKLKQKKVLITGGAGFIGSNLCEYLINKSIHVVCLDNLSTGDFNNIKEFISNKYFKFINGDIRDLNICINACKGVDYVLHHAALGSVPRSINDPLTTNEVNISGFLNMLIASRDNGVERFIFAASSSTYGDSKSLPKVEDKIGKPLSPYAVTKYVNEIYAENFKNLYDLDYIGFRYFNVFGKKQSPKGEYAAVIPKFIQKLINIQSPEIYGDGTYSRDFTYIENVIQINILGMTTENPKAVNQIYNVAVGQSTSLNDLVGYIKEVINDTTNINIKNIKAVYSDFRDGDIPHSLASVKKAQDLLNYSPIYTLKDGLKESINWYLNKFKITDE